MTRPRFLMLTAILLIPLLSVHAQQKSLSLRLGPGHVARQDQIFSPFVHTDWSLLNGGIRYETRSHLHQWIDLGFGSYSPIRTSSYRYGEGNQTYPHSFLLANLTYALGKPIPSKNPANTWAVGGFFGNAIQATTYNYGPVGNFGYFASVDLGIWARFSRHLSKQNAVSVATQLPILSWIARSPYLVNDDEYIENIYSHNGLKTFFAYLADGKLQTLNRVQQAELHLTFTHELNDRWILGAWYECHFLHTRTTLPLVQIRNVLNVSTTLTL